MLPNESQICLRGPFLFGLLFYVSTLVSFLATSIGAISVHSAPSTSLPSVMAEVTAVSGVEAECHEIAIVDGYRLTMCSRGSCW